MLEEGKIDSKQAVFLSITMITATALLSTPAITTLHAGQDAWLSIVLAVLLGLPVAWLTVKLNSLFPGKTIIEFLPRILGRWPGKLLGFLYLLWFLHITAVMIREYGDLMVDVFMHETPLVVFHIAGIALAAYTIRQGLEVIARVNQIFLPWIIISVVLIFLLVTTEMDYRRLLPVFEASVMDIFKGSLAPLAWLGEISAFAMIIPYLARPGSARPVALISIFAVGFIFLLLVVGSLAVFGTAMANMVYPVLNVSRVINIAKIIDRPEPVIMAIWVTGGLIKITFFYYILVLGSAQWLKLRDYRPLVLPLGVILTALSIAPENVLAIIHFLTYVWPIYALITFEFGIPLVLLAIALVRTRGGKKQID